MEPIFTQFIMALVITLICIFINMKTDTAFIAIPSLSGVFLGIFTLGYLLAKSLGVV